jgi:hypothetical protein
MQFGHSATHEWFLIEPAATKIAICEMFLRQGKVYHGETLDDFYGDEFQALYRACIAHLTEQRRIAANGA